MKLYPRINTRKAFTFACGLALTLGVFALRTQADQWDKRTILTVNQPVQVTDRVVLDPGQYVLKLLDSQSNRHVVQIFNHDETRIINTVIAIPAYRPEVTGHTEFRFWETPPGYAKALKMWYYPGDNYGQEFPYPKQLYALTAAKTAETDTQVAQTTETPAAEPAPQAETQQEEQTEIAQNTPPPEPAPEPQAAPEPTPVPQSQPELPKTGTPYPAIGLAGLVLVAFYGLLRLRSLA